MRVSSKTYYGYSGRFKENRGKTKIVAKQATPNARPARKFSECACTRMIQIIDNMFVEHYDAFGLMCDGSGERKDFWKY